ncbi:hypothetical protein C8J57DRAFT_1528251 [Mycena rebaudengoi]|nr:hypothetical protein C8J57DRAFT_1528251 [Mycena rebaudengoi]
MPPTPWATEDQRQFLQNWMPQYLLAQASKNLWTFWPKMREAWFLDYPEEEVLGFPIADELVDPNAGDVPLLTLEQESELSSALTKRKTQLQAWSSLASILFKARAKRRRHHQVSEVYHKHNLLRVKEELKARGMDELNEAVQGRDDDGEWIDDDDDAVRMKRVQEAKTARMKLTRQVVDDLFKAEPEEVQEKFRKMAREEVLPVLEEPEEGATRSPEDYQASIDEASDMVRMFHAELTKMTGWYGITMLGGPMPRMGGELWARSIPFGTTPGGVNFEDFHPSWKKVGREFLKFLRRAISRKICLERGIFALEAVAKSKAGESNDGDELDPEDAAAEPAEPAKPPKATKLTRRPRKSKKAAGDMAKSADRGWNKDSSATATMPLASIINEGGNALTLDPEFERDLLACLANAETAEAWTGGFPSFSAETGHTLLSFRDDNSNSVAGASPHAPGSAAKTSVNGGSPFNGAARDSSFASSSFSNAHAPLHGGSPYSSGSAHTPSPTRNADAGGSGAPSNGASPYSGDLATWLTMAAQRSETCYTEHPHLRRKGLCLSLPPYLLRR